MAEESKQPTPGFHQRSSLIIPAAFPKKPEEECGHHLEPGYEKQTKMAPTA